MALDALPNVPECFAAEHPDTKPASELRRGDIMSITRPSGPLVWRTVQDVFTLASGRLAVAFMSDSGLGHVMALAPNRPVQVAGNVLDVRSQ